MDPAGPRPDERGDDAVTGDFAAISVEASPEALELVVARLQDFDCLGTEDSGASALLAYFPGSTDLDAVLAAVRAIGPGVSAQREPPVADRDWTAEWKATLEGFELGTRYFVLPSWRERPETDRRLLVIDPERAFGTGTHETTSLVVELIEGLEGVRGTALDLGTGTGILSMVAALEGADSVVAIESDPDACRCAEHNVARNGLADRIEVRLGRLEDLDELEADLVVANIQADVLLTALPRMYGRILLSGILTDEVDDFSARLPDATRLIERRDRGEWTAIALERKRHVSRA